MKTQLRLSAIAIMAVVLIGSFQTMRAQGGYVTGDFHQHTTYTDGSYTIGKMMEMNNYYGLDWWANSEHGGGFANWGLVSGIDLGTTVKWINTGITLKGKDNSGKMWRWQSIQDWSYRDVQLWRRVFPEKLILQGYEMNVPGHEHASTCIIANQFSAESNVNPIAQFEYMFDNSDSDDSSPYGWVKSTKTGHEKAVEAVAWLQANYRTQSWIIPAHPERYTSDGTTSSNGTKGYNIGSLRDLNNAGPDVFFGFESIPGHQKSANRGEYASTRPSYGTETYGGAGWMCAKVGGLWDALLTEGRHFWVFVNSDCHNNSDNGGDFFPGEYQKNYTYVTQKNDAQAIADGLRSGNNFAVMGDLIDALDFNIGAVSMGSTYATTDNSITITIRLRDPETPNNNRYSVYTNPVLNHVDVIAGVYGDKIDPNSPNYNVDEVSTTQVIARFAQTAGEVDGASITTQSWTEKADGWKEMSLTLPIAAGQKMYFRLRGTNQGINVADETDSNGNPLIDTEGTNSAAKAFSDLWFYSNPIFVESATTTALKSASALQIQISPNPASNNITCTFTDAQQGNLTIRNVNGMVVRQVKLENETEKNVSISDLPAGIYTVNTKNHSQKLVVQ